MNSIEGQIERARQKEIKELKRKEDAKKLAVFEDVLGIAGVIFTLFIIYYIFK